MTRQTPEALSSSDGQDAPSEIDYGILLDDIGFNCRLAQLVLFNRFYETFSGLGMSPAELSTLVLIAQNPGIRQGILGDTLLIKRSALTKMMKGLEARGLVTRMSPDRDLRSLELHLSPAGNALVSAQLPRLGTHVSEATAALSAAERAILLELLSKVIGRGGRG